MTNVAVTGTNGKTSTVFMAYQLMLNFKMPAALGTLGLITPLFSTPNPVLMGRNALQNLIDELRFFESIDTLLFEAFSESLACGVFDKIDVDVAAFTSITFDHLDIHASVAEYVASKLKLISNLLQPGDWAVYFSEDRHSKLIHNICKERSINIFSYGFNSSDNLQLIEVNEFANFSELILRYNEELFTVKLRFSGSIFIYNWMCALSICIVLGLPVNALLKNSENIRLPEGRLEKVELQSKKHIYIDFATNPSALKSVLNILKKRHGGLIHLVFGCGGNYKKYNRSLMGQVANDLADVIYITNDNPDSENPNQIRSDIQQYCKQAFAINDRKAAIKTAIMNMGTDDTLLIAGKGHENYQLIKNKKIPFKDKEVVLDVIRKLEMKKYHHA